MSGLKLAADLTLPVDAVTQKLAFIGRTGSGKTYGATKLAEEMHAAGAQLVVLDPIGVWWGLRLAADGKGQGLPIPVFGGLHGDVPLEATGGALVADLIVDRALSVVLDVSQFESDAALHRFAAAFGDRFFRRQKARPAAVHLFLEECQEFVPQNPQRDEIHTLHFFQRIQKQGRNFGIGVSLITQRPQEVSKKVLNQTECLVAFQLTGKHERTAVVEWATTKGVDEKNLSELLPSLAVGEPHVWSPQWLKISREVRIAKKRTFDASSTPVVGARKVETRALAPVDLAEITQAMAATIERAKADDPKALRARIAELEREVRAKPAPAPAPVAPPPERVEVPVIAPGDLATLERCTGELARTLGEVDQVTARIRDALTAARVIGERPIAQAPRSTVAPSSNARVPARDRHQDTARSGDAGSTPAGATSTAGLTGPEQRILDELAELAAVGLDAPDKVQLALFCGYTNARSGGFREPLARLRDGYLIHYPSSGTVALTPEGQRRARTPSAPATTGELQARLLAKLDGPRSRILSALLEAYPHAIAKEDLGATLGYSNVRSGGFREPLASLRSLGLITYPDAGTVVAAPVLFLEGAR